MQNGEILAYVVLLFRDQGCFSKCLFLPHFAPESLPGCVTDWPWLEMHLRLKEVSADLGFSDLEVVLL